MGLPRWLRGKEICLPTQEMQEMQVWSLSRDDLLEKEMPTHSIILAWEMPWTEEPGGLQPMGSQRVRHGRTTEHCLRCPRRLGLLTKEWKQDMKEASSLPWKLKQYSQRSRHGNNLRAPNTEDGREKVACTPVANEGKLSLQLYPEEPHRLHIIKVVSAAQLFSRKEPTLCCCK